jgi:hypothetical protein
MQQPAEPGSSPSFAGLMAALAAPAKKPEAPGNTQGAPTSSQGWKSAPAWNDDDLAEDVATLSYECALRAHARYRSADPPAADFPAARPANAQSNDRSLTQPISPGPIHPHETLPANADTAARSATPQAAPLSSADDESPATVNGLAEPSDRNLKRASITIRLSQAECAQLRQRAAEAGLTVSAYLRSCTFEAESLRAQVKEALAQLRSAAPNAAQVASTPAQPSRPGWLSRLLPSAHSNRRTNRA